MSFIGCIGSIKRINIRNRKYNHTARFLENHFRNLNYLRFIKGEVRDKIHIDQLRLHMIRKGRQLDQKYSALITSEIELQKKFTHKLSNSIRKTLFYCATISLLAMFTGCDKVVSEKPFVNTPSQIEWSPLSAQVGSTYTGSLKVSDLDGLKSLKIEGPSPLTDRDTVWNYSLSGNSHTMGLTFDFMFEGEKSYLVGVLDAKDVLTQKGFVIGVGERPNGAPVLDLSYVSNQIDRAEFRIRASDDGLVDRLEVDFGDGFETIHVNRGSIDTVLSRNYGDVGGSFNFRVEAVDDEGARSSKSEVFSLTGRAGLDLVWRTYFDEVPVIGAEMKMEHLGVDFDTLLVSQNGRIDAKVPKGEYRVLLHANPGIDLASENGHELSNISRLIVKKEDLPSMYHPGFKPGQNERVILSSPGFVSNIDVDHTTGILATYQNLPSDLSFRLIIDGDYSNLIETLENPRSSYPLSVDMTQNGYGIVSGGYLIEEYARGTRYMLGVVELPRTDIPLIYAHNWGDKNCDSDGYNPFTDAICTPGNIPGVVVDGGVKRNFDLFIDKLRGIMNNPKVKINPYDLEVVKGYSEDISGRLITNRDQYKDGVFYNSFTLLIQNLALFSHHGGRGPARELFERKDGPPSYATRSLAYVGNASPGWFSNEETFWSARERLIPVFGSVRDNSSLLFNLFVSQGTGVPDEFQVVSNNIYQAKDLKFMDMIFAYFAHAQTQWVEGKGNNFLGQPGIGFNPQPFYRKDWKPENHNIR